MNRIDDVFDRQTHVVRDLEHGSTTYVYIINPPASRRQSLAAQLAVAIITALVWFALLHCL